MRKIGALSLYLKRAGVTTGPSPLRPTRHSDMSNVKSWLCAIPVSFGYKAHNNFGSAVHYKFLIGKPGKFKLTDDERRRIEGMLLKLNSSPVVRKIMSLCHVREKRRPCVLNNVRVNFTPDAHGKRTAMDLKTTIVSNREEFIKKAFEYGYFRQGKQYCTALKIDEYWIIGIQKERPFRIHLVLIQEFKDYMHYVEHELCFLLYFYRHYGNPKWKKTS